jgi:hypothetical protein
MFGNGSLRFIADAQQPKAQLTAAGEAWTSGSDGEGGPAFMQEQSRVLEAARKRMESGTGGAPKPTPVGQTHFDRRRS